MVERWRSTLAKVGKDVGSCEQVCGAETVVGVNREG